MSLTQTQREAARHLVHNVPNIDQALPTWARRSNPIIRRQLGIYWRVFPPQVGPIIKWFVIQSALLLLTIEYPILFVGILTFLLAALTILPYAFYVYLRAIGQIIGDATTSMVNEYKNDTLGLLRITPYSTPEIILSKISASFWRRLDDLDQVLMMALALGMPLIAIIYLTWWPPHETQFIAQGMTIVTFAASLVRLPLEMFMVATLGVMMGAATRQRSSAYMGTAVIVFFYFLLLNLARLLPLSWPLQLGVDAFLPLLLPVLITFASVHFTQYLINRD